MAFEPGDRTGFTLIEALLVVVIIGILIAVGVWRMGPALERAKVRRVISVMAGDLQYAQLMAARDRQPVVFIVIPSAQAYLIRSRTDSTTIYRERFIGPDTDYAAETLSASPGNTLEIYPNGVARQTTTFTVGRNAYQRQVRITRAGQIRIVTP